MQKTINIKKIILINLCLFFVFFSFFSLKTSLVRAETESAPKTDLIWQKERLEAEILNARQKYRESLEAYRSQERLYNIAYDQYSSLKTLAALEDLVLKTKAVLIIRDEVLINYLELLKLNLYASEGVELSVKSKYLDLLDEKIADLKKHKEVLESKTDQSGVQSSLDDFSKFADLDKLSQQILALLAISRLQRIYDLAIPLKKDIDTFLAVEENDKLSPLFRASAETDKSLNQAQNNLNILWEKSNKANSLEAIYRNLTRDLNPAYINLSQSLAYLKELLDFN
jgi:hypothetical protein